MLLKWTIFFSLCFGFQVKAQFELSCQFHQHFTRSFFRTKVKCTIFSYLKFGFILFGARKFAEKLLLNCWWNWPQIAGRRIEESNPPPCFCCSCFYNNTNLVHPFPIENAGFKFRNKIEFPFSRFKDSLEEKGNKMEIIKNEPFLYFWIYKRIACLYP